MKLLSTIDEIIVNSYKVRTRGTTIVLQEKNPTACPQITLTKNGKVLVMRFDQEESTSPVFPFFNPKLDGLNKLCDYLLFYCPESGKDLFVFLCELKAGKPGKGMEQLKAGYLFAEFLMKTAFRQLNDYTPVVQYRGLIFTPRITKGFT